MSTKNELQVGKSYANKTKFGNSRFWEDRYIFNEGNAFSVVDPEGCLHYSWNGKSLHTREQARNLVVDIDLAFMETGDDDYDERITSEGTFDGKVH